MRVSSHDEARQVIFTRGLKVVCIESVKGGTRYQCRTKGKRRKRTPFTIVVKDVPLSKENEE